jgi:hypothetical protein
MTDDEVASLRFHYAAAIAALEAGLFKLYPESCFDRDNAEALLRGMMQAATATDEFPKSLFALGFAIPARRV